MTRMPYTIKKQKCKQTDGDSGSYTLSYTDNKGKKHSNCHTSKTNAKKQISAIEMDESLDERWQPIAARITDILEGELARLAGAFHLVETRSDVTLRIGDRIRSIHTGPEVLVHTRGKVPHGTIIQDNQDGTFDVEWDPMPALSNYFDDMDDEPEETIERRVLARNIKRAKSS